MASHQVLHEGDDAPDFFVTGDPAEHISKWIDEITTHMENNFRVVGAFGDRDFIGGPPILVQITEFIDTCKRTIVVFDGRSRWANYAAQMVIHRMFQENAEKCNERLIIVLRNKEAAKQVPTFLRNNHTLNADAKDFYNKLFYSVKGYSSKERYNLNKQNEILPKQETENPGACLLELLPPQDELYLPPEPNSDKPACTNRFKSEDQLEVPGMEPGELQRSIQCNSLQIDGDVDAAPMDRYLPEDGSMPSVMSPVKNTECTSTVQTDSRTDNNPVISFRSLDFRRGKSSRKSADQLSYQSRNLAVNKLDDEGYHTNSNSFNNSITSNNTVLSETVSNSAHGQDTVVKKIIVGHHEMETGETVKPIEEGRLGSVPLSSISLEHKASDPMLVKRADKSRHATKINPESTSISPSSMDNIDKMQNEKDKNAGTHLSSPAENLLHRLKDFDTLYNTYDMTKEMTMDKSSALEREGKDLILCILKECCTHLKIVESIDQHTVNTYKNILLENKYISTSLDVKLSKLKFDNPAKSAMPKSMLLINNAVIAHRCVGDLEKLVNKVFNVSDK